MWNNERNGMTRIEREKQTPTHCYAPKERDAIREVMRWVGPWSGCHSAICGGISTGFVIDEAIIWFCHPSCIVWKSDK